MANEIDQSAQSQNQKHRAHQRTITTTVHTTKLISGELAIANDYCIELPLLIGLLQNIFFNRRFAD
jgi:hypothetical protein